MVAFGNQFGGALLGAITGLFSIVFQTLAAYYLVGKALQVKKYPLYARLFLTPLLGTVAAVFTFIVSLRYIFSSIQYGMYTGYSQGLKSALTLPFNLFEEMHKYIVLKFTNHADMRWNFGNMTQVLFSGSRLLGSFSVEAYATEEWQIRKTLIKLKYLSYQKGRNESISEFLSALLVEEDRVALAENLALLAEDANSFLDMNISMHYNDEERVAFKNQAEIMKIILENIEQTSRAREQIRRQFQAAQIVAAHQRQTVRLLEAAQMAIVLQQLQLGGGGGIAAPEIKEDEGAQQRNRQRVANVRFYEAMERLGVEKGTVTKMPTFTREEWSDFESAIKAEKDKSLQETMRWPHDYMTSQCPITQEDIAGKEFPTDPPPFTVMEYPPEGSGSSTCSIQTYSYQDFLHFLSVEKDKTSPIKNPVTKTFMNDHSSNRATVRITRGFFPVEDEIRRIIQVWREKKHDSDHAASDAAEVSPEPPHRNSAPPHLPPEALRAARENGLLRQQHQPGSSSLSPSHSQVEEKGPSPHTPRTPSNRSGGG
jgi:hypothetical protein